MNFEITFRHFKGLGKHPPKNRKKETVAPNSSRELTPSEKDYVSLRFCIVRNYSRAFNHTAPLVMFDNWFPGADGLPEIARDVDFLWRTGCFNYSHCHEFFPSVNQKIFENDAKCSANGHTSRMHTFVSYQELHPIKLFSGLHLLRSFICK